MRCRHRLRRCRRRASSRIPPHAGKPRDRAAARHSSADARRIRSHPGRRRRLGDPEGQPLRHDRRRIIDLLPDRTAPTVADWLERHPSVELVARDRSTEYARGASLGAPQAQQVADRWHLLTNCGRPSNAGSIAPMPDCAAYRSCLARPFVPPGATAPLPALRRSWKRGHRAGCAGRPSTMRSAGGMPSESPCRCGAPRRPTRRACHRDVRVGTGRGHRGRSGCFEGALEQRPGRRPDQPAQAHQASMIRTGGPRSPVAPHGSCCLIHAK